MNTKAVRYVISQIIRLEALFLLFPLSVSIYYKETWTLKQSYIISIILILIFSFILSRKQPENIKFYAKEGLVIVAMSWFVLSFFGSLPFLLSGEIPNIIDAFFETVSGFTTTGASILTDIESMSKSLMFWRSFTHLVGGMGVLVFALAIIPRSNSSSLFMMRAEVPGPVFGKLVSKMSDTARILYAIYLCMTAIVIALLFFGGMPLFDSVLHAFGTAGTGGFGIKSSSIAYYDSAYIDMVIGVAMLLFGINFNLYFLILAGNIKQALKSKECKWYFAIVAIAVGAIFLNVIHMYNSPIRAIRDIFFTVSSIITTTGYSTANFNDWPVFSHTVLLMLMFIGACAGSTAGGIKISRVQILAKSAWKTLKNTINPNQMLSVRTEGKAMDDESVQGVSNYLILYMICFVIFTLIISVDMPDFLSAFSSVTATFNNIGPGLGIVGPVSSYASLTNLNKVVLSIAMLAGRLEILPVLILFTPRTWKKNV